VRRISEHPIIRATDSADSGLQPEVVLSPRELAANLAWIVNLRWLAAAGVAVAVTVARWVLAIRLPVTQLYVIAAGLAAYNTVLWRITTSPRVQPSRPGLSATAIANLQISIDLFFLAGLLYFSGGVENPFVVYFVFHIVIASILLSRRATFFQTALASVIVLGLALIQIRADAPHYHLPGVVSEQEYLHPVFAYGTVFVVASTLFLTAYFATSITARLRQREAEIIGLSRSLEEKAADLSRANERLRVSERMKSEYMRRVAHELRSPLATVHQMIGLVLDGHKGEISQPARETLQRSRARVRLLMDVARDLLVLSRAREADLSRQVRDINLAEIVAALAPDLEARAQEAQVALSISVPPNLPAIAADNESIAQLVSNLATNAIKYTPAGGSVSISAQPRDGGIELSATDTGIGIPREELAHIFDEFFRAANARESGKEGTGLGLSIVKAICDSLGAELTVDSEPGRGTTFSVRFPLTRRR